MPKRRVETPAGWVSHLFRRRRARIDANTPPSADRRRENATTLADQPAVEPWPLADAASRLKLPFQLAPWLAVAAMIALWPKRRPAAPPPAG